MRVQIHKELQIVQTVLRGDVNVLPQLSRVLVECLNRFLVKFVLDYSQLVGILNFAFCKEILRHTGDGFLWPVLYPNDSAAVNKGGELSAFVSETFAHRRETHNNGKVVSYSVVEGSPGFAHVQRDFALPVQLNDVLGDSLLVFLLKYVGNFIGIKQVVDVL